MAELGLYGISPALVLLVAPAEALPARLGQLARLAVGVDELELLELVAEQDLLQLRLLLDVDLLPPVAHLVEGWLSDVHVARLDQLRHVPVEEGEHEGADVRSVDVGVGG